MNALAAGTAGTLPGPKLVLWASAVFLLHVLATETGISAGRTARCSEKALGLLPCTLL